MYCRDFFSLLFYEAARKFKVGRKQKGNKYKTKGNLGICLFSKDFQSLTSVCDRSVKNNQTESGEGKSHGCRKMADLRLVRVLLCSLLHPSSYEVVSKGLLSETVRSAPEPPLFRVYTGVGLAVNTYK
jgi:hypothetical protein